MTNPDNVGGQYDRELIALMLEVYASTHEAPMWPLHRESTIREQVKLLRDADNAEAARVRTVCRAAPAGGDRPETMSPPEFDGSHVGIEDRPDMWPDWVHRVVENAINEFGVMRDNERQPQGTTSGGSPDYSRITPPDSAPARSGEVTDEMVEAACDALDDACVAFHRDGHPNASVHWKGFMRADRNAVMRAAIEAALLRKLQQGAE